MNLDIKQCSLIVGLLLYSYCIAIVLILECYCTIFIFIGSYSKVGHKMGQDM